MADCKELNLKGVLWGKAYGWKISGTTMEKVWAIVGDFVGVDKWVSSVVQSSELLLGEANKVGCVRKFICCPAAPGEAHTVAYSQLIRMHAESHQYMYTIVGGNVTGFSSMKNYIGSIALSSLPSEEGDILMSWSFTCEPISTLTEQDCLDIAFPLYQTAMKDLSTHLALPENSITLLD